MSKWKLWDPWFPTWSSSGYPLDIIGTHGFQWFSILFTIRIPMGYFWKGNDQLCCVEWEWSVKVGLALLSVTVWVWLILFYYRTVRRPYVGRRHASLLLQPTACIDIEQWLSALWRIEYYMIWVFLQPIGLPTTLYTERFVLVCARIFVTIMFDDMYSPFTDQESTTANPFAVSSLSV